MTNKRRFRQLIHVRLNPWILFRPVCWIRGHQPESVVAGDAWSRSHLVCARCLLSDMFERVERDREALRAEGLWAPGRSHRKRPTLDERRTA